MMFGLVQLLAESPPTSAPSGPGGTTLLIGYLLFFGVFVYIPRYANLGAARPNGQIFCSATPIRGPINVANRAFFQRAAETRTFAIGDYQIDPSSAHAIVTFAFPVLDRAGRLAALVFADLDLAWISGVAAEAHLPAGSTVTLVDQNGTILVRDPDPKRWVGKSASAVPIFQTMLKQPREGTAKGFELDGTRSLFAFKPLLSSMKSGNVYLIVGIPTTVAFARSNRILAYSLVGL